MSSVRPSGPTVRLLPTVIIAAVALAAGIWAAQVLLKPAPVVDDLAATRFPHARPLTPFSLVDHRGQPFDNAALPGHWSFLFFGYTHCPDVCPTTLSVLNAVAQQLSGSGLPARFVLVTVDPERDTPERLAQFVSYFNQDFLGVTGDALQLEQLTRQLGVLHVRVDAPQQSGDYLVDHTAGVFLTDPSGNYHAVFTPPLSAGNIVKSFSKMTEEYR
jgi:protein SCO1/2